MEEIDEKCILLYTNKDKRYTNLVVTLNRISFNAYKVDEIR